MTTSSSRPSLTRAICAALVVVASGCTLDSRPSAGFWFAEHAFVLSAGDTSALGGALGAEDVDRIERVARAELMQAFSGLRIDITDRHDAMWRVSVVSIVTAPGTPAAAGGSVELGGFGGSGSVGLVTLAANAIRYAPKGASRAEMLDGIGRGVGRAAAHELAHQILSRAMRDDKVNVDSYEYFSADRASQYYGRLSWRAAAPLLREKLGG